jgi:two-component system, NarL family, nitrate/nitrite response regulator NarL
MSEIIRLGIIDSHQAVIDNYLSRLANDPDIKVVFQLMFGESLEFILQEQAVDVLILDVSVPTNPSNDTYYPIINLIPHLVEKYPHLSILVISMYNQFSLVSLLIEAGVKGYILKDDRSAIADLPAIIRKVHKGKTYFSSKILEQVVSFSGEK